MSLNIRIYGKCYGDCEEYVSVVSMKSWLTVRSLDFQRLEFPGRCQSERYQAHRYVEGMKKALQNRELIKECLNTYRDDDHKMKAEDVYWPTSIFCGKCNKDTTEITGYDGEYGVSYKCECGCEETVDIRNFGGIKLGWRVDWPMRWNEEKVCFEPGGKDHISPGGSYDTAKLVSKKIYNWDAPVTMKYDFVKLKGVPGKMSSSKGKVISLIDALEVYQPEVLRYIFAQNKVDHEFSISFDLDVVTVYEAYDKTERLVWGLEEPKEKDPAKKESILLREKRIYELSQIEPGMPKVQPYQVPFRLLTTLLQTYDGDIDAVIASLGDVKPEQEECLRRRCACAWYWINESAPDCAPDFCFKIRKDGSKAEDITGDMLKAVQRVRDEVVPKVGRHPIAHTSHIYCHGIQNPGVVAPHSQQRSIHVLAVGISQFYSVVLLVVDEG